MKAPTIGLFKAMSFCGQFERMGTPEKQTLQAQRLRRLVAWAKANSPYYAALYQNIGEDASLEQLPPVNKRELMERFDDWITAPGLCYQDVEAFMQEPDNIGRKLRGKYLVFTTSGSTGHPLVCLCDDTANNVMGAISAKRTFTRKEDLRAFFMRGGKTIGVFATGGFYLGYASVRAKILKMPWKKRQMAVTSALLPVPQIVAQLNAFQPAMLGGYPSNLELLIDEQQSGRLHISPVLIMTGGEHLSDALRDKLAAAFHCYVQTSYSCTEGGTIACECKERHFHINEDWLIVEPVDQQNRPVPDGVQSDKILLTNLYNFTQPFIRYEVTDRVVMHHEPCSCGNPAPWLTLEGRTDDVVSFIQKGREIKIAPLAIYATLKEVHALRRFQLLVYANNRAKLRLEAAEGVSKGEAFARAKEALMVFLEQHGVTELSLTMSDEAPKQHPGSGKYKHIIRMDE